MSVQHKVWGVDPGSATGCIVEIIQKDNEFEVTRLMDLPIQKVISMNEIALERMFRELRRWINDGKPEAVFIERLAPRGMMAKMLVGYGSLLTVGPVLGVPMHRLTPQQWKSWAGVMKSDDSAVIERSMSLIKGMDEYLLDPPKKYWPHRADASLIGACGIVKFLGDKK